jgi:hypothetical protein
MAAVFCLVLLPAIAAIGCMIEALRGQMSGGAVLAALTFTTLTAFVFGSVLGMIKKAEDEAV